MHEIVDTFFQPTDILFCAGKAALGAGKGIRTFAHGEVPKGDTASDVHSDAWSRFERAVDVVAGPDAAPNDSTLPKSRSIIGGLED